MSTGTILLILFGVSLLFCCVGFKRFVWFMSVGYGLSAAGIGAALLVLAIINKQFAPIYLIQCVLFVIYGFRLGGFLLIRELKNDKYKARLDELGMNAKTPVFVSAFMWIYCGALYVMQASGPVFRLCNRLANEPIQLMVCISVAVSVIGVCLEALSDKQKSAQKAENPKMPAMKGLFRMCRCPNYFGEILFWTGAFLSGIGAYQNWWQWTLAIVGYITIFGIMVSGAKRLETRHIKNYGQNPEYNAYADKTPILFPLLPIYHLTSPEKIAAAEAKKAARK